MRPHPTSIGQLTLACALALAGSAATAAPVLQDLSLAELSTSAILDNKFTGLLISQPDGPTPCCKAESFVEWPGNAAYFASGLSEWTGNMEVGVEVAYGGVLRGSASSEQVFAYANNTKDVHEASLHFNILPGEILFKFDPNEPGPGGKDGAVTAMLSFKLIVDVPDDNFSLVIKECLIGIKSLNQSFATTDLNECGEDLIDQEFHGQNGWWGYTTKALSFESTFLAGDFETGTLKAVMSASATGGGIDWPGKVSVKFGDPLDPGNSGSITIPADPGVTPVGLPGTVALTALGLAGLGGPGGRRRRRGA